MAVGGREFAIQSLGRAWQLAWRIGWQLGGVSWQSKEGRASGRELGTLDEAHHFRQAWAAAGSAEGLGPAALTVFKPDPGRSLGTRGEGASKMQSSKKEDFHVAVSCCACCASWSWPNSRVCLVQPMEALTLHNQPLPQEHCGRHRPRASPRTTKGGNPARNCDDAEEESSSGGTQHGTPERG